MIGSSRSIYRRLGLLLVASVMVFWACQLTQDGPTTHLLSFTKQYDDLSVYDSVVIIVKDRDGNFMDTVYQGKVDQHAEIERLPVDKWDGGEILIEITGFNAGQPVYKIEKKFDGNTNHTDTTRTLFVPGTKLTSLVQEISIIAGDSQTVPVISITPTNLFNKSLIWASSNDQVLQVSGNYLKALQPGIVMVTVSLKVDPAVRLIVNVTVVVNTKIPEGITIAPDTLFVAAGGATGHVAVKATPSSSSNLVVWHIEDTTIALISADGTVRGIKQGMTILHATSKEKSSVASTAFIVVLDPVPVTSVRFFKDSIDLYLHGAAESLIVEVLPSKANQEVEYSISDSSKISLQNGRIVGLSEGVAQVFAKSKESITKKAALKVRVLAIQNVDSVRILPRTLKLYTGGVSQNVSAKVFPLASAQKVQWSSSNPAIAAVDADGKVNPVLPGLTRIVAVCLSDSSKKDSVDVIVKRDSPIMTVGQDTVISLGQAVTFLPVVAPQEFGAVVKFKWDLDGNSIWDDSSETVKEESYVFNLEKIYSVRFYVRDTEGNETIVTKRVSAVKGSVVNIVSPANNSYSRVAKISVVWKVNNVVQDSLTTETLAVGLNTVKRTYRDIAGSSVSASSLVTLDSLAPNKPVLSGPAYVASTQPTWTWVSGGSGGNGKYRIALDVENFGSSVEGTDTLFKPGTPISEGSHTLFVQERDAAGNWSASGSKAIIVDVTPPAAVTFIGTDGAYTDLQKPTWTWTASPTNGGTGVYVLKLDAGTEFELTTATYTPASVLADNQTPTLTVREKDQVAGVLGAAKSFSYRIKVNPAAAPKVVSASGKPTSAVTNNPKFTWTSGGGGNGIYRVRLNAETAYQTHPQPGGSQTEWSLASGATDGAYTIRVSEQDSMGRWGAEGIFAIQLDRTGPVVTNIVVKGTLGQYALREGYITNASSFTIFYKSDGVDRQSVCNLPADSASNTCLIVEADSLGNKTTVTRNVWRRSGVIFIKSGGTGSGSSWEEASGDLAGVVGDAGNAGREIWIASGSYSQGLLPNSKLTILGGFDASTFPTSISGRNKANTYVAGGLFDFNSGGSVDGLVFTEGVWVRITSLSIIDCRLELHGYIKVIDGGSIISTNLIASGVSVFNDGNYGSGHLIFVNGISTASFDGGSIVNNIPLPDLNIIHIEGTAEFKGAMNIYGNKSATVPYQMYLGSSAKLTVDTRVNFNCNDIWKETGSSGSCKGNPF